eukprot:TRINITY_DN5877_c0_g1_i2.p2 TRINITY_DN5877_c0_g1~~TRINITY_DN5877_c0_g1_i2.p2  ORF type:complete len:146 (+),score=5.98 TRINITY_DN5877_c0_g1_i2:141-578(+)
MASKFACASVAFNPVFVHDRLRTPVANGAVHGDLVLRGSKKPWHVRLTSNSGAAKRQTTADSHRSSHDSQTCGETRRLLSTRSDANRRSSSEVSQLLLQSTAGFASSSSLVFWESVGAYDMHPQKKTQASIQRQRGEGSQSQWRM